MMLRLWSGCWRKVRSDTRLEARCRYESAATMSISSDAVAVRVLKVQAKKNKAKSLKTLAIRPVLPLGDERDDDDANDAK